MRRIAPAIGGLIAAVAAAALLAGCGGSTHIEGGGGPGGSGGAPLSPSAYKGKVNGICAEMTRRSDALAKPKTSAQVLPFVQKVVAAGNAEIAQIKALAPPPQYAAGEHAVVADLTRIFGTLGSLAGRRITAEQFAAALRTRAFLSAAADYVQRSRAAGLASCVLAPGT